jgi:hypothetical protein
MPRVHKSTRVMRGMGSGAFGERQTVLPRVDRNAVGGWAARHVLQSGLILWPLRESAAARIALVGRST